MAYHPVWQVSVAAGSQLSLGRLWEGQPRASEKQNYIVGAWETGQNKAVDPKKSGCLKEQCLYQYIGSFWDPQIPALYRLDRGLGH